MREQQEHGRARARRGSALVPTLVVLTSLAIFGLAMIMSTMAGARSINHQADEYRLSSAVESVAILAMEQVWTSYIADNGGAPGSIGTIESYLDSQFGEEAYEENPPWDEDEQAWLASPAVDEGYDLLQRVLLAGGGEPELNDVRVDAMKLVRRDSPGEDSIQLWITVSASTNRGKGVVYPALNRAVQQVWTIEPESFDGFDFALLANNVNCIFCHSQIDNVERYYNEDSEQYGDFDRVKVGALESIMLRRDMDGKALVTNDYDTDSTLAGTLYVRGVATDHNGSSISDWSIQSFHSFAFDASGNVVEDPATGAPTVTDFSPAGDPPQPLENLYLEYSSDYADMVDGNLPTEFPPPFPDNGGLDPLTGEEPLNIAELADNKIVDDEEFYALTQSASGAITAGIITVKDHGDVVDNIPEYASALFFGNQASIQHTVDGNVILSGTEANPITLDGMVAIDGDLIINGYVKGSGSLYVKGNVYVPTDLQYLDGQEYLPGDSPGFPTGPSTFGVAQDGTSNALAIAAGGNVLVGDYTKPSAIIPGQPYTVPAKYSYISGDAAGQWNFSVAEISLFNRSEWAKTQPTLPDDPGEALDDPSTWTLANPVYEGADYVPRYYGFGPGDEIPIYNKGNLYFDAATETWHGDAEVPLEWDPDLLTIADPTDPSDPVLFPSGAPNAVIKTLTPTSGWIDDYMYKLSIEHFEDTRPYWTPMQIDGLLYTNNAIFTLVHRVGPMVGQMVVNGSLVASDLGMLAPGYPNAGGYGTDANVPNSPFAVGLQLNYDPGVKSYLEIENPLQVQLKRTLWNPTANLL